MHLVQLLLPTKSNSGKPLPTKLFGQTADELIQRFKGLTAYNRAPADGLWKPRRNTQRDEMIVYEVMVSRLQKRWWHEYRQNLEQRFEQECIVIRAQRIETL